MNSNVILEYIHKGLNQYEKVCSHANGPLKLNNLIM